MHNQHNMNMSEYYNHLPQVAKQRYIEKIAPISVDPYVLKAELSQDVSLLPKITSIDITNYFVYEKSAYTQEEFKAYKSLESYNQFVCGWVKHVASYRCNEITTVVGKVVHSQKLREKPLVAWVMCKADGVILCAHCNCVAGLGEACSHIGAICFLIEDVTHRLQNKTVTDVSAYWVAPSISCGKMSKSRDICYKSPKELYKKRKSGEFNEQGFRRNSEILEVPQLSTAEMKKSLEILFKKDYISALHLVVSPYCDQLKEKCGGQDSNKQIVVLSQLFNEELEDMDLEYLQITGKTVDLSIDLSKCQEIEQKTKQQAASKCWFQYRIGRITASRLKACVRTNVSNPSYSLISSICHNKFFKSKYTTYGCEHEQTAINDYKNRISSVHTNFDISKCGFIINPLWPHMGATPDSLLNCDCCGLGCLEIKCPYCAKQKILEELAEEKKEFCLQKINGQLFLKNNHSYYFQIQMQLAVTERGYSDFVVWTPNGELHIERIKFDKEFWNSAQEKATDFFYKAIMPELLGKYFSNSKSKIAQPCTNNITNV